MIRAWRFIVDHYLLLPVGGGVALVWANTYAVSYFRIVQTLAFPINDIGMAFVLAYLAQELVEAALPGGSLHPFRRALLPIVAGIGGTVGAALVYLGYLQTGDEQILAPGWPIASTADLVVAVATSRAIFGRSPVVTEGLLIALTSEVIGLAAISRHRFITDVHPFAVVLIGVAAGMAMIFRRLGVTTTWLYVGGAGTVSWLGCYWAGIQPVLALLPIVPFLRHAPRELMSFADDAPSHRSPTHFESSFEIPVQLVVLLFAFVNFGIGLRGFGTGTWAVMAASLIGRPLGIVAAIAVAQLVGQGLPVHMDWKIAAVTALAAAPTLTFGVLIAVSVFPVGPLLVETKLGAVGTFVGVPAALGAARLLRVGRFESDTSSGGFRTVGPESATEPTFR